MCKLESDDETLLAELRRDEDEVPYAYQDSEGYWTIGVGFLIDQRKGGGLLPEEINFILQNRVRLSMEALDKKLPWWRHLSEARQRVLVNMVHNLGIGNAELGTGLLGFKNTLAMIQVGDYEGAADGMLHSKWARQVGDRARRLSAMMRKG